MSGNGEDPAAGALQREQVLDSACPGRRGMDDRKHRWQTRPIKSALANVPLGVDPDLMVYWCRNCGGLCSMTDDYLAWNIDLREDDES